MSRVTSVWIPELKRRISLRIPEEQWPVWQEFLAIAKRERRSPGSIIFEEMKEYVRLHGEGNPQARLDVILKRGAPPKEPPTCSYCLKPATYISYVKAGLFSVPYAKYTCDVHRNLLRAQNPYYGERKL